MRAIFNWKNGVYRATGTPEKAGDFRVTIASDWGALWDYEEIMQRDPLAVYGDLLPLLRESDLNIVNVECALDTKGAPIPKGGPNLRSAPGSVRCLTEVPFHVACLANNHSMDFGPESLQETIGLLQNAGIETVGAGGDGEQAAKPLVVQMKDVTLGVINCAEGESCASIDGGPGANPFDVPIIEAQIRELKRKADAVLVIFHGGCEMAPCPPPYVVEGLRRFAEADACAVIGHHAHVPQGVEIHGGVPIAYSLGNFVFRWQERDADFYALNSGYLVHLDFAGKKLAKFSITPYRTKPAGVSLLSADDKAQLFRELKQLSELTADPAALSQMWDAFVDVHGEERLMGTLELLMAMAQTDARK
jgi:poly-gamma-glutamate synthesis protein (capsule biosynthesis protein)